MSPPLSENHIFLLSWYANIYSHVTFCVCIYVAFEHTLSVNLHFPLYLFLFFFFLSICPILFPSECGLNYFS
jgi:hypothetical protein